MFFNIENCNQRINTTFKELTSLGNFKSIVSNMKTRVFLLEKPRQIIKNTHVTLYCHGEKKLEVFTGALENAQRYINRST